MASGSFSGTGTPRLQIDWTSTQNGQNSSSVTAKVYCVEDYNVQYSSAKTGSITINGSTYNFTYSGGQHGAGSVLLASYTVTVKHDINGNASINISSTYNIAIT